jgi:hypothetical protein
VTCDPASAADAAFALCDGRRTLRRAFQFWRQGTALACGLTFELSGPRRSGAWPARRMMTVSATRAKRYAGVSPLQRGVSRRCQKAPRSGLPCQSSG